MSDDPRADWIGGVHPVEKALELAPERALELCLSRPTGSKVVRRLERLARSAGVKTRRVSSAWIEDQLPRVNHQGVALRQSPLAYVGLDSLLSEDAPERALLCLDGVTDPRNLGGILRTAWAFGVHGVVIPQHRAAGLTPAAVKAAAGAADAVRVCRVSNTTRAIERIKGAGFWVFGASGDGGIALPEVAFPPRVALVLGGEGKGLRPGVRKACDDVVRIPMSDTADSLNVGVAAGVLLAQVFLRDRAQRVP